MQSAITLSPTLYSKKHFALYHFHYVLQQLKLGLDLS